MNLGILTQRTNWDGTVQPFVLLDFSQISILRTCLGFSELLAWCFGIPEMPHNPCGMREGIQTRAQGFTSKYRVQVLIPRMGNQNYNQSIRESLSHVAFLPRGT